MGMKFASIWCYVSLSLMLLQTEVGNSVSKPHKFIGRAVLQRAYLIPIYHPTFRTYSIHTYIYTYIIQSFCQVFHFSNGSMHPNKAIKSFIFFLFPHSFSLHMMFGCVVKSLMNSTSSKSKSSTNKTIITTYELNNEIRYLILVRVFSSFFMMFLFIFTYIKKSYHVWIRFRSFLFRGYERS